MNNSFTRVLCIYLLFIKIYIKRNIGNIYEYIPREYDQRFSLSKILMWGGKAFNFTIG